MGKIVEVVAATAGAVAVPILWLLTFGPDGWFWRVFK